MFFTSSATVDLLLLAIVGTIGLHILYLMRRQRWLVLDPLNPFWGGFLVTYILQSITYYDSLVALYSVGLLIKTLFFVWWSVIFVIFGYESRFGQRWGYKLPNLPERLNPQGLFISAMVMLGLGLVGYAILIASAGGLSAWASVGRGGTNWSDVGGYLAALENFFPAGVVLLIFCADFFSSTVLFRIMAWSLGILTWLWFVYLGTRLRTIIFLLSLLAVYYIPRRKNPSYTFLIGAAVGLFFLTSFQAFYRGQFTNFSFHLDQLNWSEVKAKILPHALGGERDSQAMTKGLGDLEMNVTMAVVEQVPEQVPYNYGYTLVELFTHAVPRQLWPAKIYPLYEAQTPIMLNRDLSRHHLPPPNETLVFGPSFTFVGYWYHAGGAICLAVAGFLTGIACRMIRTFVARDPSNQGNMVLYALIFTVGFFESAFTPLYWVFSLPLVWIPVIIMLYRCRQRSDVALMPALEM